MRVSQTSTNNIVVVALLSTIYFVYWSHIANWLMEEIQVPMNYVIFPLCVGIAMQLLCVAELGVKLALLLLLPALFVCSSIWDNDYALFGLIAAVLQYVVAAIGAVISFFVANIPKRNSS